MSDARPVWLTREQREVLNQYALDLLAYEVEMADAVSDVVAAWDAAPADPVKVVKDRTPSKVDAMDVLRALGYPAARDATTTP